VPNQVPMRSQPSEAARLRRLPRGTEDMDVTEQNGVRGLTSNDVCLAGGLTVHISPRHGFTGASGFDLFA
jgi:hypothetical protein